VDTVARNRGKAVEDVLKSANGLTFYGSEAIKAGLADSINSLQETIAMATDNKGTTKTAAEIEAEEKQAAKAAEEKAAMQAQLDLQAAQIKTMTEKAAKEASDRATAECKAAVKQAYGREATEEEVKFYVALGEDGRKVYKASLAEAASNIDRIAKKAGLTTEQVTAASDEELNELGTGKNLIVDAMRDMGLADAPAKK
jgi:type II secretory pathway component HofQ